MQLAKVERTVTHRNGKKTHEIVWLVTCLPPEKAGSEQLLQLIRAYWENETGVHQRLDVALQEDQCRIRDTQSGWALGWLHHIVIAE